MTSRTPPLRRRPSRRGPVRAQRGVVARGLVVAVGLVAAVALQVAGPRLQCRLGLVSARSAAPVMTPTTMQSCGSMRPCKVVTAATGFAPET